MFRHYDHYPRYRWEDRLADRMTGAFINYCVAVTVAMIALHAWAAGLIIGVTWAYPQNRALRWAWAAFLIWLVMAWTAAGNVVALNWLAYLSFWLLVIVALSVLVYQRQILYPQLSIGYVRWRALHKWC